MPARTFFTLELQATPGQPGIEKSLADWGLAAVSARFASLAPSKFTFRETKLNPILPLFEWEDWVVLRCGRSRGGPPGAYTYSGGKTVFQGICTVPGHVSAAAGTAALTYSFEDPWWYLQNECYQMVHHVIKGFNGDGTPQMGTYTNSSCFLFMAPDATVPVGKWSTGQQIQDAIAWARDFGGIPIQAGVIEPANQVPIVQVRDRMCSEVIELALKTHPDCVAYFDYSTFPVTLHVRKQSSLSAVAMPWGRPAKPDVLRMESADFRPRPDLQTVYVSLHYRSNGNLDGQLVLNYQDDLWPPDADEKKPGGIVQTVDLSGFQATTVKGSLTTLTIPDNVVGGALFPSACSDPANQNRIAFWGQVHPQLQLDPTAGACDSVNQKIRNLIYGPAWIEDQDGNNVTDAILASYGGTLRVLSGNGTISSWMRLTNGAPVVGQRLTLKAYVGYSEYDGPGASANRAHVYEPPVAADPRRGKQISVELTFTNGVTGNYSALSSLTSAEPIPEGLAKAFYDALQQLQYDGSYSFKERPEATFSVGVGNVLNFVSASTDPINPDWANARMLIQAVEVDLEHSRTTLHIAPAKHGTIQDLIELYQFNRLRVVWRNPAVRNTGQESGGAMGVGDGHAPIKNSTHALGLPSVMEIFAKTNLPTGATQAPGFSLDGGKILASNVAPELNVAAPPVKPVLEPKRRVCCDPDTGAVMVTVTVATDPFVPA